VGFAGHPETLIEVIPSREEREWNVIGADWSVAQQVLWYSSCIMRGSASQIGHVNRSACVLRRTLKQLGSIPKPTFVEGVCHSIQAIPQGLGRSPRLDPDCKIHCRGTIHTGLTTSGELSRRIENAAS
jgi:hypothetical protein